MATVDLGAVRNFRSEFIARSLQARPRRMLGEYTPATHPSASISGHASAHIQASSAPSIPTIEIDFSLTSANCGANSPSVPRAPRVHGPMEEIALGPSGWLWDYLRRVQARDSSSVWSSARYWRVIT